MKITQVPEYLNPKEAIAIIQKCPKPRDKLILRTMWETGGRVAEVLSLVPDYIDSINNCLHLSNLKQKSIRQKKNEPDTDFKLRKDKYQKEQNDRKESLRLLKGVPEDDKNGPPLKKVFLFSESTLCQDLLSYVEENKIGQYNWVFYSDRSRDGRVSTTYIWFLVSNVRRFGDRWKRRDGLATVLQIKKDKGASRKPAWPHLFRHACAMYILDNTGSTELAQRQLGHARLSTTQGYAVLKLEKSRKMLSDLDWK